MSDYLIWGVGLFGVAALLLLIELLIPTGGIVGLTAIVVALAGVVAFWYESTWWGVSGLMLVIVAIPTAFHFALKIMPNTSLGRALILGSDEEDEQAEMLRAQQQAERHAAEQALIGAEGVAETELRPIGYGRIDGTRVSVTSIVGVIDQGQPIRVVSVEGNDIKVRPI